MPRGDRRCGGLRAVSMSVMPSPSPLRRDRGAAGRCVLVWREGADLREYHGFSTIVLMRQQRSYDDYVPMTRAGQSSLAYTPAVSAVRPPSTSVTPLRRCYALRSARQRRWFTRWTRADAGCCAVRPCCRSRPVRPDPLDGTVRRGHCRGPELIPYGGSVVKYVLGLA
jgi:hypothetical protein